MRLLAVLFSFCFSSIALSDVWTYIPSAVSATSPLAASGSSLSITKATASSDGYLSSADWSTFNNKLDQSRFNYITNSDAEIGTVGWNLYNDSGRTTPAYVVDQDITYTSTLSGGSGNGATVSYTICGSTYVGPIVTCPTGTSVQVCWYNGPTLAQNPTATVLKAAYDAQSCATAIATSAVTGTATTKQYQTGTLTLANGGDTQPIDGTGGTATGVTFTQNTSTPLVGLASFDLGKDANSREGSGVSTDFIVNSLDKGQPLQISFAYSGSSGMVLGTSSDVRVFLYDITDASFISVTPLNTIKGPVSTAKMFVGQFTASPTSVNYRLVLHIATSNASAWDLLLDSVTINDVISAAATTQVPSVVLKTQPISGLVTDHMAVAWTDGASQWVPATATYNGDYWSMLGFATNIIGSQADIYVHGYMDGFSFGPFAGYNQYVDPSSIGNLTPLPVLTDTYTIMGKAISATAINIQPYKAIDLITSKGSTLVFNANNDGNGDSNLPVGSNGTYYMANSAAASGIAWTAPVATAPIVYTSSTHTFSCTTATNSVAGCMSSADHTGLHAAVTIGTANGLSLSVQALSLAAATDSVPGAMTAADHTTFSGLAPKASPIFTGTVNLPAINLINGATNGTNTVLVYKNGHIKSTITTPPTAAVNANAGTGATCSLTNATDTAGYINLTSTATSPAAGTQCTVSFNAAYGVAPICLFSSANAAASSQAVLNGVSLTTTVSSAAVVFANSDITGHIYKWAYHCIETQ